MENRFLLTIICDVILSFYLVASETNPIKEPLFQKTSLSIDNSYESNPFPIKTLDPQILAEFMPLIMREVAKEFSHQNDHRTRRNTREYGLNYFKMLRGDFSYKTPPEFYQQLGAHICKEFGHNPIEFTNIILSVYEKDFYLEPHVDVSAKDLYVRDIDGNAPFYFGERVYGIVIEPDSNGHLYFVKWEGEDLVSPLGLTPIYSLKENTGTIICLEGDFRQTPYFHAVSPVSNHRISITFRTVEKIFNH